MLVPRELRASDPVVAIFMFMVRVFMAVRAVKRLSAQNIIDYLIISLHSQSASDLQ